MMDAEDMRAAIAQLQADLDAERAERDILRKDHDALHLTVMGLAVKAQYRLLYDATVAVGSGTETSDIFETLPGTLHAIYAVSAYAPDSDTPVIVANGPVESAPSAGICVSIQRQRQSNPTRIECRVLLDNSGSVANVAVRVWRRLGIGS